MVGLEWICRVTKVKMVISVQHGMAWVLGNIELTSVLST